MNSSWNVGGASAPTSVPSPKEKIPYIGQMKSNDQMTEGQKLTVSNYNLMRTTLIKNGLMDEK
jgi:hypothetical protein